MPVASPYETIPPDEVERGRLLAAIAYLPGLCLLGLLGAPENAFVAFHSRQGLLLLLVEIAIWIFLGIYDASIGRIPFLGPLVGYLVKFVLWTGILLVTIYGVAKAANGQVARLPILGDHIERIPF